MIDSGIKSHRMQFSVYSLAKFVFVHILYL
jgi:hypothetical protein